MLFDPTKRNVDPFLFPARILTMKELILTLAIHDKNVTMAKTAQVSFIIRTGLTPPSEDYRAAKTQRNNEIGLTALSKQRFVIAVPTHTRSPSPTKVQVHCSRHISLSTPRLHWGSDSPPQSSQQWPAPLISLWPTAVPCPHEYEQEHKESGRTENAVWYDPLLTQSPAAASAKNALPQAHATRRTSRNKRQGGRGRQKSRTLTHNSPRPRKRKLLENRTRSLATTHSATTLFRNGVRVLVHASRRQQRCQHQKVFRIGDRQVRNGPNANQHTDSKPRKGVHRREHGPNAGVEEMNLHN